MATITDYLETVFVVRGLDQFVRAMATPAPLLDEIAQASGRAADVALSAAIQLRNLGGAFPIEQAQALSDKLSDLTGVDDELILQAETLAAQFGLTGRQIEQVTQVALDASAATGRSLRDVEAILLRASRGRPQGLVGLGIDPSKVAGDIHNIDNLITQLEQHFQGVAAARLGTLPGARQGEATALENLQEAVGRIDEPNRVGLARAHAEAYRELQTFFDAIADFLAPLGFASPRTPQVPGGGSSLGLKGDPEQTTALHGIERNTQKLHEELLKGVLGPLGPGARGAVTIRDVRIAFGV